jgi:hypothetical protein
MEPSYWASKSIGFLQGMFIGMAVGRFAENAISQLWPQGPHVVGAPPSDSHFLVVMITFGIAAVAGGLIVQKWGPIRPPARLLWAWVIMGGILWVALEALSFSTWGLSGSLTRPHGFLYSYDLRRAVFYLWLTGLLTLLVTRRFPGRIP